MRYSAGPLSAPNTLLALAARRRVKVRRLPDYPAKEGSDIGILDQALARAIHPGQFGIVPMGMDNPVADWMDGHRLPPLLRPGHGVVPLHPAPERSLA